MKEISYKENLLKRSKGRRTAIIAGLLIVAVLIILGYLYYERYSSKELENKDLKVVVLFPGDIHDSSWNTANANGVINCEKELNIRIEKLSNIQNSDFETLFIKYGSEKYDLVIAAGSQFEEAVSVIAPQYPETEFVVVNGREKESDGYTSVFIKEEEASRLAAIIAGNITKTGQLGIIGGYPNKQMDKLLTAYENNAVKIAKEKRLDGANSIRAYTNSWTDVNLGKQIVKQFVAENVDIVFIYANEIGVGCIPTLLEEGMKMIGFATNQTKNNPDTVPASIEYDLSNMYRWIIHNHSKNKLLKKKYYEFGIREGIFKPVYSEFIAEDIRNAVHNEMKKQ